jgi:HisJ family histidinol phosphate phosphatase
MIDFEKIIKSSQQYNFHTHTQYCDGRDNIESFVKSAISQDFHWLGFSPHSPVLCESGCNMKKELVSQYTNEVETMKSKYGCQINIFTGMEIDFFDNWGPSNEYFKCLPLDYRIGSIHFIPSFNEENEYVDVDGCSVDFKKKMSLYFDRVCIKSVVWFGLYGHFNNINIQIHEHGLSFCLLECLTSFIRFQITVFRLQLFYLLDLFLGILLFVMQL